jgi:hypothetical protein
VCGRALRALATHKPLQAPSILHPSGSSVGVRRVRHAAVYEDELLGVGTVDPCAAVFVNPTVERPADAVRGWFLGLAGVVYGRHFLVVSISYSTFLKLVSVTLGAVSNFLGLSVKIRPLIA